MPNTNKRTQKKSLHPAIKINVIQTAYKKSKNLEQELEKKNIRITSKKSKTLTDCKTYPELIIEFPNNLSLVIIDLSAFSQKTSDLINLHERLEKLLKHYGNSILILQNFNQIDHNNKEKYFRLLEGLMLRFYIKYQTSLLPCGNCMDVSDIITSISRRIYVQDTPPSLARKKPSRSKLEQAQLYLIEGLHNTGPNKANKLLQKFETPLNIINALKNEDLIQNVNNMKENSSEILSLSGFGEKFVENNQKLLFNTL